MLLSFTPFRGRRWSLLKALARREGDEDSAFPGVMRGSMWSSKMLPIYMLASTDDFDVAS